MAARCAGVTRAMRRAVLLPVVRALHLGDSGEALDVTDMDEVPDSSWFTNREATAEQAAQGACAGAPEPTAPFVPLYEKPGGATGGLVARDALGRTYVLKVDIRPREQPELSTAADAIVSRIYWVAGYNVPCNRVVAAREGDFALNAGLAQGRALVARVLASERRAERTRGTHAPGSNASAEKYPSAGARGSTRSARQGSPPGAARVSASTRSGSKPYRYPSERGSRPSNAMPPNASPKSSM